MLRVLDIKCNIFFYFYSSFRTFFSRILIRIFGRSGSGLRKKSDPYPDKKNPEPKHWIFTNVPLYNLYALRKLKLSFDFIYFGKQIIFFIRCVQWTPVPAAADAEPRPLPATGRSPEQRRPLLTAVPQLALSCSRSWPAGKMAPALSKDASRAQQCSTE